MIGFNSRESYQDAAFDIQTQELAGERMLETRIYRNGKILARVQRPYGDTVAVSELRERMSGQHEETCGKVRDGNYALIFLWVSRGIIHLEAGEYASALDCFESVLALDGNNTEVESQLNEMALRLQEDRATGRAVEEELARQVAELAGSGRELEADRKRNLGKRLGFRLTSPSAPEGSRTARWLRRFRTIPASLRIHLPAASPARPLLVGASFLFLALCVGLIQADTQVRLSPQFHGRVAAEYLQENRLLAARHLYAKLLLQNPGSEEALSGFWSSFHRHGDHPSAIPTLEEAVKTEQPSAWALFCLAEAYRSGSRCSDAVPFYREAVRRGIPEAEGMIGWGLCLLEQGGTDAAIRLWEPLLDQGQEDFRIDMCLGHAYQQQGMPGRASMHFSSALQKNPAFPLAYTSLAGSLEAMHQHREAENLRKRAEGLAPKVLTPGPASHNVDPFSALLVHSDPTLPAAF